VLHTPIDLRSGGRLLFLALLNTSLAITLGLGISNTLRPGDHLAALGTADSAAASTYAQQRLDVVKTLISYVPSNVVAPFAENTVITVIVLALLLGFGLRRVRDEQRRVGTASFQALEDALIGVRRAIEVILGWVVKLIPLAVFGVVCKTVAEHGFAPLMGLLAYVVAGLLGLALHIALVYQAWIALATSISLRRFWSAAREPMVYALGTNSSLATLPVTLRALDRLGVSQKASALGACVGTNLNNDGIVLYEGMAMLFVAQAMGIDLSLPQQLFAALTCIVAAMGVAGVPEAGFVSLALVLNTVGLPVELLPLLLTVDWVLARARSVTNVLSDMVLSILLDAKPASARATLSDTG
jgi:Na+/H+-dicarboxylate symporter